MGWTLYWVLRMHYFNRRKPYRVRVTDTIILKLSLTVGERSSLSYNQLRVKLVYTKACLTLKPFV